MRVGRGIRKEPTVQEELAREHSAGGSRMIVKEEEKLQEQLPSNRKQSSNHPFRGELLNFRGVFYRIIRIELKKHKMNSDQSPAF